MVVHNADRFGLASLHQLRGRIGRDVKLGYCFCLTNATSKTSLERLKLFKNINDGFKLSEEDYKMRGSGTILGTRQHGVSEIMSSMYFTLDGYEKAKKVYNSMSDEDKQSLKQNSENKFAQIFNNIVLN